MNPDQLNNLLGQMNDANLIWKALVSAFILAAFWFGRRILLNAAQARVEDAQARYRWRNNTRILAVILYLVIITPMWLVGLQGTATYLGLIGAGLAISLQEILLSIAGWLFILVRRPFKVGDRIQVGEFAGDVIDQDFLRVTLLEIGNWVDNDQSTGRILIIPNSMIFRNPLANYSGEFQFIWNEIPIHITIDSNWRKAKELLTDLITRRAEDFRRDPQKAVEQASQRYFVFYKNLTPTVYTSVHGKGILLTIRYVCDPRLRRMSTQVIWEDVLTVFAEHSDIQFLA